MVELRVIADGLRFPEGPIALPDGDCLVVEIARGTLTRISPTGHKTIVAETGPGPNGAAIGPDGLCYICDNGGFAWADVDGQPVIVGRPPDHAGGSIRRVDLKTGAVETLYTHCDGRRLLSPNDIVFDREGGFWFTDYGARQGRGDLMGSVYYAPPGGGALTEPIFPRVGPNGVGLSPDEKTLYVAETTTGRVWAHSLPSPGVAEPVGGFFDDRQLLYGAPGLGLYDSLAVEACGNICVATLGRGGITVISPHGQLVDFVSMGDPNITNICFGGENLQTAYVTLSGLGQLAAMDWPRPGLALNFSGWRA